MLTFRFSSWRNILITAKDQNPNLFLEFVMIRSNQIAWWNHHNVLLLSVIWFWLERSSSFFFFYFSNFGWELRAWEWASQGGDSSYVANGFTCQGHQRLNPLYYIAADQHVANEHTMKYWVKRAKYQCVCQNVWFSKLEWVGINCGPNPVPIMKRQSWGGQKFRLLLEIFSKSAKHGDYNTTN